MRGGAVTQIQVYKALVGYALVLGDTLEVGDRLFVQQDGDLLFELSRVGIFPRGGEVVFFAHVTRLWVANQPRHQTTHNVGICRRRRRPRGMAS